MGTFRLTLRLAALLLGVRRCNRCVGRISGQADSAGRAAGRRQRDRHGRAQSSAPRWPRRSASRSWSTHRAGGALTIGLDLTASPSPTATPICMGPIGALAITRHMVAKLPYDIERDFQPIALVTRGHLLLAVSPTPAVQVCHGAHRLREEKSGQAVERVLQQRIAGPTSAASLFKYMSGTEIVHVPYRGGAAAINDLIAGRVHLMFESLNSIAPHAKSGTVRALAVSGARRSPGFPELPTVAEAGVPGYEAPTWSGVIAPSGVPRPIVDKLNAAINRAIGSQTFKDRFAMIGDEPAGGHPGGSSAN